MFETERDRFRYVRKKRSRTLTLTRPNIAPRSPRTMLTRVNRSGVYKNERLFRTAQSLPQRAFNIGLWGSGGGTDDGTACDASVYFAHTGLQISRKGGCSIRPSLAPGRSRIRHSICATCENSFTQQCRKPCEHVLRDQVGWCVVVVVCALFVCACALRGCGGCGGGGGCPYVCAYVFACVWGVCVCAWMVVGRGCKRA